MSSRLPGRLRKLPEAPTATESLAALAKDAVLPQDAVEVGRVGAPVGLLGHFRLHSHSGGAEVFEATPNWFLKSADRHDARAWQVLQVQATEVAASGPSLVARCREIDSRTLAEEAEGAAILIPRSQFPALPAGEYYWTDLIGLTVRNREGVLLGRVSSLIPTGPHQVLVVRPAAGEQRLIPFVHAYVDRVALDQGEIRVDWQPDY